MQTGINVKVPGRTQFRLGVKLQEIRNSMLIYHGNQILVINRRILRKGIEMIVIQCEARPVGMFCTELLVQYTVQTDLIILVVHVLLVIQLKIIPQKFSIIYSKMSCQCHPGFEVGAFLKYDSMVDTHCAHALAYGFKLAATMRPDQKVLINLSGRGDKDVQTVAEIEGLSL